MEKETSLPEWLASKKASRHWSKIGFKRRVGLCTPLASVRSERDLGVGDIGDLFALVDFSKECGLEVIQLLPLNDMGQDFVPYSAISAFAIDPVYLAVDRVEGVEEGLLARAREVGKGLNASSLVEFREVRKEKEALLFEAWRSRKTEGERERILDFERQNPWLDEYALFRAIREQEGYRSWTEWASKYEGESLLRARRELAERIEFFKWEQMLLSEQLKEARRYAKSRGVLLVGDIPILVARDSADCFWHKELFFLDTSAGAPPDMYSEDGQNWGFPTYNWQVHREQNFDWWRQRLLCAERYFDLYRIDHVVGFFRIWTIPIGERSGRHGRFVPEDESLWGPQGREILEMMLETTEMLPLAEDLGTIPPVCRSTLFDLGICGLKVQRWERYWEGDGSFIHPKDYHPLSVATLSTHDSETFAHYWEAFPEDRARIFEVAGFSGPVPERIDPYWQSCFIRWFLSAGSIFVILMVQEWLLALDLLPGSPAEHRINVPGVVNERNFRWRWPVTLERLLERAQEVRGLLKG